MDCRGKVNREVRKSKFRRMRAYSVLEVDVGELADVGVGSGSLEVVFGGSKVEVSNSLCEGVVIVVEGVGRVVDVVGLTEVDDCVVEGSLSSVDGVCKVLDDGIGLTVVELGVIDGSVEGSVVDGVVLLVDDVGSAGVSPLVGLVEETEGGSWLVVGRVVLVVDEDGPGTIGGVITDAVVDELELGAGILVDVGVSVSDGKGFGTVVLVGCRLGAKVVEEGLMVVVGSVFERLVLVEVPVGIGGTVVVGSVFC